MTISIRVTSCCWTISPGTDEVMNLKLSGHDTFPLRYGWLFKAASFVNQNKALRTSNSDDAEMSVVELGVGKNMVNAIRYWSESVGITETVSSTLEQRLTETGKFLIGTNECKGRDPYLEKLGSVWLVHFLLNFDERNLTAYRYFFNFSNLQSFDKDRLIFDISSDLPKFSEKEVNHSTVKKDVECFLHTYCKKYKGIKQVASAITEDYFSSPLTEIGILSDMGKGFYLSEFADRQNLPPQIFMYGLYRFVSETLEAASASFESLLVDPYSPGRIFRLSESGLARQLDDAMRLFPNLINVTDTAGQRHVVIKKDVDLLNIIEGYW